jgi:hypothetical protein
LVPGVYLGQGLHVGQELHLGQGLYMGERLYLGPLRPLVDFDRNRDGPHGAGVDRKLGSESIAGL